MTRPPIHLGLVGVSRTKCNENVSIFAKYNNIVQKYHQQIANSLLYIGGFWLFIYSRCITKLKRSLFMRISQSEYTINEPFLKMKIV